MDPGFAVWITGLPASGKSTLASALREELESRGVHIAVLESDALRKILTPDPRYDARERDIFYGAMAHMGKLLTDHGVPVIFDATANRRIYRERARRSISMFLEVFVECPLSVCIARDPKGIYRKGRDGTASGVPGLQEEYEPPEMPDVVVKGDAEAPVRAALRIVSVLVEKGYLKGAATS